MEHRVSWRQIIMLIPHQLSGTSIITYVLLCGYAPFRSDDPKELLAETMEAKIQFHDKYWGNVSDAGV